MSGLFSRSITGSKRRWGRHVRYETETGQTVAGAETTPLKDLSASGRYNLKAYQQSTGFRCS